MIRAWWDRLRILLEAVRIFLRTVLYLTMLRCGFVPINLYRETFDRAADSEAKVRGITADRRATDVWQQVAAVRKAALMKHGLYTPAIQDVETQCGLIGMRQAN